MTNRSLVAAAIALSLLAVPTAGRAQHSGGAPPLVTRAPKEASQYDFLIGQWDLVVKPKATTLAAKVHGVPKLLGTWKAWRAFEGFGLEDDLRIVDASGNPKALTHFVRVYDAAAGQWNDHEIAKCDLHSGGSDVDRIASRGQHAAQRPGHGQDRHRLADRHGRGVVVCRVQHPDFAAVSDSRQSGRQQAARCGKGAGIRVASGWR